MATLAQLQAYEASITAAMGDPTKESWFDDFRQVMRPVTELAAQLEWVRAEIANSPENANPTVRVRRHLARGRSGL